MLIVGVWTTSLTTLTSCGGECGLPNAHYCADEAIILRASPKTINAFVES